MTHGTLSNSSAHILAAPTPAWFADAECRGVDTEVFFGQRGDWQSWAIAVAVCDRCEVRAECLAYALEHHERFGIWGGKSERERRVLRRSRSTRKAAS